MSQSGCGPSGSSRLCDFILGSNISAMTLGVDGPCGMEEKIPVDGRLSHEDQGADASCERWSPGNDDGIWGGEETVGRFQSL